jgi:DNA-binding PadR family transcriptional regulator
MRITPKIITVLTLLEKSGPKYGQALVDLAPTLFFGTCRLAGVKNLTSIYSVLKTMEKGGVIEYMKDFHPDVEDGSGQAGARKWYTLTAAGRKVLADARAALGVN